MHQAARNLLGGREDEGVAARRHGLDGAEDIVVDVGCVGDNGFWSNFWALSLIEGFALGRRWVGITWAWLMEFGSLTCS
ncbi:hypothetical protein ACFU7Y_16065, partial [Kitasatospora sp. NPDC057542]|uniref:hypothetical protein n=1 Tax=Kitasatospora sp. NPDC057542 TaxID=3346162 RepID=UPI0036B807D2